jgi:antitoxin (DNA-binding transcriptional repressor) of toxin-antitoxin stability system
MIQVDIDEAKTRLSELAHRAADGESFIIADAGKPLVEVVRYAQNRTSNRKDLFGCMQGQGYVAKDLDFKTFCHEDIADMFGMDDLS